MTSAWTGFHGALVLVFVVAPLEWVGVFHAFGLYRVEHLSAWEEFRGIISATTVGVGVIMVSTFWWEASVYASVARVDLALRDLLRARDQAIVPVVDPTAEAGRNADAEDGAGRHERRGQRRLARVLQPSVRGFAPIGCVSTSDAVDADMGFL